MSEDNENTIIEDYDIQAILAKYNSSPQHEDNNDKVIELSDEDDIQQRNDKIETPLPAKKFCNGIEDNVNKLLEELSKKYNFDYTSQSSDQKHEDKSDDEHCLSTFKSLSKGTNRMECVSSDGTLSDNDDEHARENIEKPTSSSYKANKKTKHCGSKALGKQQLKEQKQKEREMKKEEAKRSKEIKKAIQMSNKQVKPEEAVKFITVNIDEELFNATFASQITRAVENLGSTWKSIAQVVPNSVTWTRKTNTHKLEDDGELVLINGVEETGEILLLMEHQQCMEFVQNNGLAVHIEEILSLHAGINNRITLGIYAIQSNKNKKNAVSKKELEFALTEVQLLHRCCHRFLESGEDVGAMIAQFTKSIAQIPYKLEKQEKYMQADWYIAGDNKDCVRVDKDGNGLQRLWQQQLTSFHLARIETAEAIMSKYPTLNSLLEAYSNCSSETEQQQLLQDIPIRRAAGPVTSIRKIGPELSKKIATFYNSTCGTTLL